MFDIVIYRETGQGLLLSKTRRLPLNFPGQFQGSSPLLLLSLLMYLCRFLLSTRRCPHLKQNPTLSFNERLDSGRCCDITKLLLKSREYLCTLRFFPPILIEFPRRSRVTWAFEERGDTGFSVRRLRSRGDARIPQLTYSIEKMKLFWTEGNLYDKVNTLQLCKITRHIPWVTNVSLSCRSQ
jgi:hypothetical protein